MMLLKIYHNDTWNITHIIINIDQTVKLFETIYSHSNRNVALDKLKIFYHLFVRQMFGKICRSSIGRQTHIKSQDRYSLTRRPGELLMYRRSSFFLEPLQLHSQRGHLGWRGSHTGGNAARRVVPLIRRRHKGFPKGYPPWRFRSVSLVTAVFNSRTTIWFVHFVYCRWRRHVARLWRQSSEILFEF